MAAAADSIDARATEILRAMNQRGGYPLALVCTERGLLVAAMGEPVRAEALAGFTSLFDDIVARAARDLGLAAVDEVTLCDARAGRYVVRPLTRASEPRLFLVVQVPRDRTWRRNTAAAARALLAALRPLLTPTPQPEPRDDP